MKLVTPKDVADQLGIRIETVYRYAQDGVLPIACRLGPRIRFDQDAIDEWVKRGGTVRDAR